jgi:mycoredoxin
VTLYTLPYCPDCRAVRNELESHGVVFHEINVAQVPGAVQEMLSLNGGKRSAPTIRIGDHVLIDPDSQTLNNTLFRLGVL